jgi:hypothetical protein
MYYPEPHSTIFFIGAVESWVRVGLPNPEINTRIIQKIIPKIQKILPKKSRKYYQNNTENITEKIQKILPKNPENITKKIQKTLPNNIQRGHLAWPLTLCDPTCRCHSRRPYAATFLFAGADSIGDLLRVRVELQAPHRTPRPIPGQTCAEGPLPVQIIGVRP